LINSHSHADTWQQAIIDLVLQHQPNVQAIYLFGSWGTADAHDNSDVDLALLLPVLHAKACGTLYGSPLHMALELQFRRNIDLINLREVSTVLQKEVISVNRRIWCADLFAADEFEMLTISFYQKLNDECADIIKAVRESGRAIAL